MIRAYEPQRSSAALAELEEGQLVEVSQAAFESAGLDEVGMDEETDGEYPYERMGFIVDVHEDSFSWTNADGDGSIDVAVPEGETAYVVGMAPLDAGAHPFPGSALEPRDRDTVLGDMDEEADPSEMDEPEESDDEENVDGIVGPSIEELESDDWSLGDDLPRVTRNQMGLRPVPESWRESNKPARLIAMDAWTSMGATFRGCRREMVGSMRNPNRFCAAFKDYIMGHPYWRSGG